MNCVPRDLRIAVVGTSGCSLLSALLSRQLDLPHIELNSKAKGCERSEETLHTQTASAVAGDHWVIDGDSEVVRNLVWPRASMIVWLDLARPWVLGHGLWRALRRLVGREPSESPPCSPKRVLQSLLHEHEQRREEYNRLLDCRWVRLTSWADAQAWLRDIAR